MTAGAADDRSAARRLAALDEALRAGSPPDSDTAAFEGSDTELDEDRKFLRVLELAWPRAKHDSAAGTAEPVRIGRFVAERLLGSGGFGIVYLATDPLLNRPVALKIPQPHIVASPELRERFLLEARAAAALNHSNIVSVYEAGDAGAVCYIASAYCPGLNLAQWLESTRRESGERGSPGLDPRAAAQIVAQLADAVQYSHERGILHRDLKPANVLLGPLSTAASEPDRLPFVPLLTDFGLAKVMEASVQATRSSVALGTPAYMAPEQAEGRSDVGPAADVYGLGVILYELLAGSQPFDGDSLPAVLDRVRNDDPTPPSRLRPNLSRDLETICLKCLRKEPHARYRSAGELANDLRRFLDGESIHARRAGTLERMGAWHRRRERIRDAGVFALVLNVLIAIWLLINGVLMHVGLVAPASGGSFGPVQRDSFLLGTLLHLPLVWIGWKTVFGSRSAILAGTVLSLFEVIYVSGCLLRLPWITPFGTAYDDPNVRTVIFSMLLVMFAAQLYLYCAAWIARSNRPWRGL